MVMTMKIKFKDAIQNSYFKMGYKRKSKNVSSVDREIGRLSTHPIGEIEWLQSSHGLKCKSIPIDLIPKTCISENLHLSAETMENVVSLSIEKIVRLTREIEHNPL